VVALDSGFVSTVDAACVGLAASFVIERLGRPRVRLRRPWHAWALHGGLWLSAHALLTLVLARPWFASAVVSAFFLMLVLVNNAKVRALREPFVFQDYEYFTDAIRHPRLYIPFMGWGKVALAALGFVLAVAVGLWAEPAPDGRWRMGGQFGGLLVLAAMGAFLLVIGSHKRLPLTLKPDDDLISFGLLPCLWGYAVAARRHPIAVSPFATPTPIVKRRTWPHLVAVQSESFFDPRELYVGIRRDVLAEFDRTRAESVLHGKLRVPAWGANTVRTEFAFLTGLSEAELGVDRFNPYRAIGAGWRVASFASYLKALGYRTMCIHPYPASFYQRDHVYPCLGFDDFIDIHAFDGSERAGPYIGDLAVLQRVIAALRAASSPVFIFVITMENHGPLHLERVKPGDVDALYTSAPPARCEELTVYLRHLRNADAMLGRLRRFMAEWEHPSGLCWFGDHVPIMADVYESLAFPAGETEYLIWTNDNRSPAGEAILAAHQLGIRWLEEMGLR